VGEGPGSPSLIPGETAPKPVRYTASVSPGIAGFAVVTTEPGAAAEFPIPRCSISPKPVPFWFCVNTPGEVEPTHSYTTLDGVPLLVTWIVAVVPVIPYGTIAEICPELT